MDEEGDGSPETADLPLGAIRVTLQRGKEFVLSGDDAIAYRRQVEPFVLRDPAGGEAGGPFSGQVTGHLAPRPAVAEPPGRKAKPPDGGKPKPRRGHRP